MSEDDGDVPLTRKSVNVVLGRLTFAIGVCLLATDVGAAGLSSRTQVPELVTLVATGNALSEAALEKQTGPGLSDRALITNDQGAGPRIQLWDELKIGPLMAPGTSGLTPGGPAR
jgi:hypothetical protein